MLLLCWKLILTESCHIFWTTWRISMKCSGKMLKVTKNQGFTLYLEDTFLEASPPGFLKLSLLWKIQSMVHVFGVQFECCNFISLFRIFLYEFTSVSIHLSFTIPSENIGKSLVCWYLQGFKKRQVVWNCLKWSIK